MSLRLFDSATRAVRPFEPLVPGRVGIYLCGATVQAPPHLGHVRAALAFDVLVRWLRRTGNQVTMVRNVTDIDDKILAKAAQAGQEWWAWAYANERAFTAAYDALGLLPPTYEPRATGHVPAMIELMTRLVERGHAYVGAPGEVWFDVRSWPAYGELTNQAVGDMEAAPDVADGFAKRDPRDFALWKAGKTDEPASASWDTPYGRGRPGWHLECSAMAHRYLGEEFDIHAGGLDLRFPHHENEQAQSRAAGYGFARCWLHNGWVTQSGEKMSKSLGNGLLVSHLLAQVPPAVLRYALVGARYRSMLEWGDQTLSDAAAAWERLASFVERVGELGSVEDIAFPLALGMVGADPHDLLSTHLAQHARAGQLSGADLAGVDLTKVTLPAAFTAAMDDDLDVPAALAVVHETLRAGNTALACGHAAEAAAWSLVLRAMLDVLGLDPVVWRTSGADRTAAALDALVAAELAARADARASRDFAAADAIRDRLAAAGVAVEDSPSGSRWTLA